MTVITEAEAMQVAHEALHDFALSGGDLSIMKASNNFVYRVTTARQQYALRVHRPGYRRLEWIESELAWLMDIRQDTDLLVPEPAAPVFHGRVGETPVFCTLLHWLDGDVVPPSELTEAQAEQIGIFIGRLHEHSAPYNPLSGLSLPQLDFEERLRTDKALETELFTESHRRTLNELANRVRIVITKNQNHRTPIHGDLIWKNIILNQNNIGAIDFDDCVYGPTLYDLAPTLLGYKDETHYETTKEAIWRGYTSVKPKLTKHKTDLDILIAGRYALSCLWIANNRHNPTIGNKAQKIINTRMEELRRFLRSGEFHQGDIIL